MNKQEIVDTLAKHIKNLTTNESSGHDWWHIKRVYDLATNINKTEHSDLFLIQMIALTHDLFDDKFFTGNLKDGFTKLLQEAHLEDQITPAERDTILFCIENLGFKGGFNHTTLPKEGQIVQDADRIDAIGAIGIARCFAYNGKKGNPIYDPDTGIVEIKTEKDYREMPRHALNHFYEKLLKLKDTLNTATAKTIAAGRTIYMEDFLKEFYAEWAGEK